MTATTINAVDVPVYTCKPAKYTVKSLKIKKYNSKRMHKKLRGRDRTTKQENRFEVCSSTDEPLLDEPNHFQEYLDYLDEIDVSFSEMIALIRKYYLRKN